MLHLKFTVAQSKFSVSRMPVQPEYAAMLDIVHMLGFCCFVVKMDNILNYWLS